MTKRIVLVITAFAIAALACDIPFFTTQPTLSAEALQKAVAETLSAAELVQEQGPVSAGDQGSSGTGGSEAQPATPTATFTTQPTITPTFTQPPPCTNIGHYIADVTIADGTELNKNQAFTKTWRLENAGTCTWTSGYQIVYDHGDQMSAPAASQLTAAAVAPGQQVDVSINMTAPAAVGEYKGFWKFKEPSGAIFALTTGNPVSVEIKVVDSGAGPVVPLIPLIPIIPLFILQFANAPLVAGESGSVWSDGTVIAARNVGDTSDNRISQAFLSFDISAIPADATISSVKTSFGGFDFTPGGTDPFPHLGYMFMYPDNYGSVDASDFTGGYPLGAVFYWASSGDLSAETANDDLKAAIQAALGGSRFKARVEFRDTPTDFDGVSDMVRLSSGIKLIITYTAP